MKDPVRNMLDEVQYGGGEIDDGFDYADAEGWGSLDELTQLGSALSDFSYDNDQPADEEVAPWKPVGWDDD
jgi:hypothetical protein